MVRRGRTHIISSGNKNAVSNVRVIDPLSGVDGARLDRMLSSMQNSHSQTRLVCGDIVTINAQSTGDNNYVYTGYNVAQTDDFQSFAAQFETYRVTAIRFEVYDVAPNTPVFSAFSTFHDVGSTGGGFVPFIRSQVIDGPDSQVPPAGGNKLVLSWLARGSEENGFYSTRTNTGSTVAAPDFGGLRYSVGVVSPTIGKYELIVKAVVDFRGRL